MVTASAYMPCALRWDETLSQKTWYFDSRKSGCPVVKSFFCAKCSGDSHRFLRVFVVTVRSSRFLILGKVSRRSYYFWSGFNQSKLRSTAYTFLTILLPIFNYIYLEHLVFLNLTNFPIQGCQVLHTVKDSMKCSFGLGKLVKFGQLL